MQPSPDRIFPPFRLDPVNQCLWREDVRIEIAPKPFAVLRYLVDHPGRLVTQEELLEALWPETYVQPEILPTYTLEPRKPLGDEAKPPRRIRTFPKRRYQFVAPISSSLPEPSPTTAPIPIGREAQLADLNASFEQILQGRRQVVFVTGESGIGKTTVSDAFQQMLALHPS